MSKQQNFLQQITEAVETNTLLKITLGHKRDKETDLKNVFIKPVLIKNQPCLSFVYRHNTHDITKNFVAADAIKTIHELLEKSFYNADLYTSQNTIYYSIINDGKEKLITKNNEINKAVQSLSHDKQKNRIIQKDALYLQLLGITSAEGNVKKEMQHKYKQINRYVEIIEGVLKETDVEKDFSVVDMGSGKGYLTFALYDYLQKKYAAVNVTGIEIREDLVLKCNNIAAQSNYTGLHFKKGNIIETELSSVNMLIALHACDTATDDAIAKGIKSNAKYIICAPCCHKQIRNQMAPNNALKLIIKHGILLERQAEMVTDTIRALVLEAYGYKTKVFEFIEEEDTPKNVLIVGTKSNFSENIFKQNMEKVQELKNMFGVKEHYLEGVVG